MIFRRSALLCTAVVLMFAATGQSAIPSQISDYRSSFYWNGLVFSANSFCERFGASQSLGRLRATKLAVSLKDVNKYEATCEDSAGKTVTVTFSSSADPGSALGASAIESHLQSVTCGRESKNTKLVQLDATEKMLRFVCMKGDGNEAALRTNVDYVRVP